MNLNKLEKATEVYKQIQIIDKQVSEFEKMAMLVAEGNVKISLDLNIIDLDKKRKSENKLVFDEDNSIVFEGTHMMMFGSTFQMLEPPKKNKTKPEYVSDFKNEISERTALNVFGVLLLEKKEHKRILLNKLKEYGVSIKS